MSLPRRCLNPAVAAGAGWSCFAYSFFSSCSWRRCSWWQSWSHRLARRADAVAADAIDVLPRPRSRASEPSQEALAPARGVGRWDAPNRWLAATVVLTIGALALAVVMAPPRSASAGLGLGWLLFVGSSVHVAGTGWLYTLDEVRAHALRHQARYVWAPVGLVVGGATASLAFPPLVLAWLLAPYFAWQFVHFQKQNLGMAALAASSRRLAGLKPAERRALSVAGLAGVAGLVARPGLLQLRIDPGLGALFPVAVTVFAAAVVAGVALLARRPGADRPAGFCVVYLTSLCFSLPVFVFRSPYAAVGGMTIAHGLQYLLLVGLVAASGPRGKGRLLRLAALGNVALIGGVALNVASHLHGGDAAARCVFGAYLGVVMAHFVIDAGLWRLRDPFPRQFLSSRVPYLVAPGRHGKEPSLDDRSAADI
jgi:hypothetical protein